MMKWLKFLLENEGKYFVDANRLATIGSQLNSIVGPVVASAATIAPTYRITHISGTVAIANITPPYPDFQGEIVLIPDAAFTTVTTGNVGIASTGVVAKAMVLNFDGSKWYPSY